MRAIRGYALVILTAILTLLGTSQAWAEEPQEVKQNFVDLADAVADDQAALEAVREVPGTSLYVVVVNNFGTLDASDWATRTAEKSGLQSYDGLIAIATQSREIGYSPGHTDSGENVSGVVDEQVITTAINDDVKDLLHNEQWDEGVILIAQNVATLAEGGSIASPIPLFVLLALSVIVVIVLIVIVRYGKKKKAHEQAENLARLSERASSELVRVDDAVRSAAQELEFAQAEFGLEATQEFSAALTTAQKDIEHAFSLRTLLEDDNPETPLQQQQMNTQILQIAQSTAQALNQQQEGFRALRNLSARVQEKVAELRERIEEISEQLPLAQAQLENLKLSYSQTSLASVNHYPQQIEELLKAARHNIDSADSHITKNERNNAVGYTQLAERTLAKAAELLQRIDHAPQLLAQAQQKLAANIESLSSDLEDAANLGKGDEKISAAAQKARAVLQKAQSNHNQDLLSVNALLQRTEEELDSALASVRAQAQVTARNKAHAASAQAQADEALRRAEIYINDYRAGVNANARTYLARAHDAYRNAEQAPLEQKVAFFRNSKDLAEQALRTAHMSIQNAHNLSAFAQPNQAHNAMDGFLTGMLISSVLNGLNGSLRGGFSSFHGGDNMGSGFNFDSGFDFGAGRGPGGRIGF